MRHRRATPTAVAAGVAALVLLIAVSMPTDGAGAAAAQVTITEYTAGITGAPSQAPGTIAPGPDGNVWFTQFVQGIVTRITPSGTVTEFPLPAGHHPAGITGGPAGKVWVAVSASVFDPVACNFSGGHDYIAEFSTDGQRIVHDTADPHVNPAGITAGPDGALWYAQSGYLCINGTVIGGRGIGRTTTAGASSQFTAGFTPLEGVANVAAGWDGRIWFTDLFDQQIGAMTTSGTITRYALTSTEFGGGIARGPDGNMWFAVTRTKSAVARVTPDGTITYFRTGLPDQFDVFDVTSGPDGALWFVGGNEGLGQITTAGTITMVPGLTAGSQPSAVTSGPGDTVWVSQNAAVAKATVAVPPPPSSSTSTTAPASTATSRRSPVSVRPASSATAASVTATPRFTG